MVSNHKSELFSLLDFSWSEAFVCLNHHKFGVHLDKSNSPVLIRENIVVDGAETELRFQGLAECPKASFECKVDVPSTRFPF